MHARATPRSTLQEAIAAAMLLAPLLAGAAPTASAIQSTEMPMGDYLGLLAQVSPAAHAGARAYLDAHRRRCGRDMSSAELRAAMAVGNGNPVLMAMIRASHLQDAASLTRLEARLVCTRASL